MEERWKGEKEFITKIRALSAEGKCSASHRQARACYAVYSFAFLICISSINGKLVTEWDELVFVISRCVGNIWVCV